MLVDIIVKYKYCIKKYADPHAFSTVCDHDLQDLHEDTSGQQNKTKTTIISIIQSIGPEGMWHFRDRNMSSL